MKWSKFQKALFSNVSDGEGHTVVEAVAGSGKTSSLLEALNHIPEKKSWIFVAFNKRIAEELKRRAPDSFWGEVRTLHSLGLKTVGQRFDNVKVDGQKLNPILNKVVGKDRKLWDLKTSIRKTVNLCKSYLIDGAEFIDIIIDNHDIDTCNLSRDEFIHLVMKTLGESRKNTRVVDFADMIWFCHVFDLKPQQYDRVMIDECQDLTNAQVALALKACKPDGRILACGDRKQAIYSWVGASLYSMDKIKKKLNATELPLSITYRCPQAVVREAQKFAPQIEAAPGAPEGIVDVMSKAKMIKHAEPGCFILSRANAPLIGLALGFIKQGKPASIQGRDIGDNLIKLIKKSRRKSLSTFLPWLDSWEAKEVKRIRQKRADPSVVQDKAACLRALADVHPSLAEIKQQIKFLFEDTDDHGKIICSTAHRAKGLERDVVYILKNTFRQNNQEERNILYVAITRSAGSLFYVS